MNIFYKESIESLYIYIYIFFREGGSRVSDFFLQRIQIIKKNFFFYLGGGGGGGLGRGLELVIFFIKYPNLK